MLPKSLRETLECSTPQTRTRIRLLNSRNTMELPKKRIILQSISLIEQISRDISSNNPSLDKISLTGFKDSRDTSLLQSTNLALKLRNRILLTLLLLLLPAHLTLQLLRTIRMLWSSLDQKSATAVTLLGSSEKQLSDSRMFRTSNSLRLIQERMRFQESLLILRSLSSDTSRLERRM